MSRRLTAEEFTEKSRAVHGMKYDYSLVDYHDSHAKVDIVCPAHGPFRQKPNAHLNGQGCPECADIKRGETRKLDRDAFVAKAAKEHNGKYDYSRTVYTDSNTLVEIICPVHGSFMQRPAAHLFGHGCRPCSLQERDDKRRNRSEGFISKAMAIYGDQFDYSQVGEVRNNKQKVQIVCRLHGPFMQHFNSHLAPGRQGGCPECKKLTVAAALSLTHEEFVARAEQVHEGRYGYPLQGYVNTRVKLPLFCKVHGVFDQTPDGHLQGQGCPKCAGSNLENDLEDFVSSLRVEYIRGDKKTLKGKELDFLFPSHNLAIELNGNYWHSSAMLRWKGSSWVRNHQKEKTDACAEKGIRLIHFYESDLRHRFEIVKSQIKVFLGVNKEKIAARKTKVVEVPWRVAKDFLHTYHLQGSGAPGKVYGLEFRGELVAVMQFNSATSHRGMKADDTVKELARYASKGQVQGGASKLLAAFRKHNPRVTTLVSYSDRRWATGGMYKQLGFQFVHHTPPDYMYTSTNMYGELQHKSNFRRSVLAKKYPDQFDPALSERENCHKLGFYQIFNCGLTKWSRHFQT